MHSCSPACMHAAMPAVLAAGSSSWRHHADCRNNGEMAVRQTNGLINLEWKFIKGGPCWLCT
jgi:hypothetical protein